MATVFYNNFITAMVQSVVLFMSYDKQSRSARIQEIRTSVDITIPSTENESTFNGTISNCMS